MVVACNIIGEVEHHRRMSKDDKIPLDLSSEK